MARGVHESLTNSFFRSAYELLYTPVPQGEKRRIKALVDVSVDEAGRPCRQRRSRARARALGPHLPKR